VQFLYIGSSMHILCSKFLYYVSNIIISVSHFSNFYTVCTFPKQLDACSLVIFLSNYDFKNVHPCKLNNLFLFAPEPISHLFCSFQVACVASLFSSDMFFFIADS